MFHDVIDPSSSHVHSQTHLQLESENSPQTFPQISVLHSTHKLYPVRIYASVRSVFLPYVLATTDLCHHASMPTYVRIHTPDTCPRDPQLNIDRVTVHFLVQTLHSTNRDHIVLKPRMALGWR